jgi:hypothetical protein
MTPTDRAVLRWGLAAAVEREIAYREKARAVEGSGEREAFAAQLLEMGKQLRSYPGFVEPTPAGSVDLRRFWISGLNDAALAGTHPCRVDRRVCGVSERKSGEQRRDMRRRWSNTGASLIGASAKTVSFEFGRR